MKKVVVKREYIIGNERFCHEDHKIVDIDKMTLEPEKSTDCGLFIPEKCGGSQIDSTILGR
ncbi:hypothetical protein RYX36_024694, partial [Vicia faba]